MAPLDITAALLKRWQRTLLSFIWTYKKPRLSHNTLSTSRKMSGLILPHLEYYYKSSLLSTFLKRYASSYRAPWKDKLDYAFYPADIKEVAWMNLSGRRSKLASPLNLTILKEWDNFRRLYYRYHCFNPFLPRLVFLPGKAPLSFPAWREGSVTRFWDVTERGHFLSKEQLEDKGKVKLPWLESLTFIWATLVLGAYDSGADPFRRTNDK